MLHFHWSWNRTFSSNHGLNINFHSLQLSFLPSLFLYSLHYATVNVNIGWLPHGLEHTEPRHGTCLGLRQIAFGVLPCTE